LGIDGLGLQRLAERLVVRRVPPDCARTDPR
jgi:hypothetical protein